MWGRGGGREAQGTTLSICLLKFILIHCLPLLIQPTPSSFQSLQHFALGRTAGLEQKKKIKIGINSLVRTKEERKTEDGKRKWCDLSLGSPRKSCLTRGKVEIMTCGTHRPPLISSWIYNKEFSEARMQSCGKRVDDIFTVPLFWESDRNLIFPALPRIPQCSSHPPPPTT